MIIPSFPNVTQDAAIARKSSTLRFFPLAGRENGRMELSDVQWVPSDLRTKEKAQLLIKLSQYNKVNQTHRVQTGVICDIKLWKTDEGYDCGTTSAASNTTLTRG